MVTLTIFVGNVAINGQSGQDLWALWTFSGQLKKVGIHSKNFVGTCLTPIFGAVNGFGGPFFDAA